MLVIFEYAFVIIGFLRLRKESYMEKDKDTVDSSYEKNSSFKIYSMRSSYINYLDKENIYSLNELKGKTINNLPFINGFLKADICKLEEVEFGEAYILYTLEFQRPKIVYDNNLPLRIMQHERVEFIHYYKLNMGCIYENKVIDSIKVLSIGMVLAYWAIISNYRTRNVLYGKPIIDTLTIDLSEKLNFFEDYLLKYIKYESNDSGDSLVLMENWWEEERKQKNYEVKLLRKNSIKYTINLTSGDKGIVILSDKGMVKSTIPLSGDLINKYIYMISLVTRKPGLADTSFNIFNILDQWIIYINQHMYEEYKIKKKIAVIHDFKNIIIEALENKEEASKYSNDILMLSLFAEQLFSICKEQAVEPKEEISIDIIEYDNLCAFLKWYAKDKAFSNLRDAELQNILQSFYLHIRDCNGKF
jgi:hypothetical protein